MVSGRAYTSYEGQISLRSGVSTQRHYQFLCIYGIMEVPIADGSNPSTTIYSYAYGLVDWATLF